MEETMDDPLLDTKERLRVLAQQLLKERREQQEREREKIQRDEELAQTVKQLADKIDAMGRGIEHHDSWLRKWMKDVASYAAGLLKG